MRGGGLQRRDAVPLRALAIPLARVWNTRTPGAAVVHLRNEARARLCIPIAARRVLPAAGVVRRCGTSGRHRRAQMRLDGGDESPGPRRSLRVRTTPSRAMGAPRAARVVVSAR